MLNSGYLSVHAYLFEGLLERFFHFITLVLAQKQTAATTIAISVLMPLSQLAEGCNFCFNFLLPSLSVVRIFSSQAISFQILLYLLFPRFLWLTLLPFPSYFKHVFGS